MATTRGTERQRGGADGRAVQPKRGPRDAPLPQPRRHRGLRREHHAERASRALDRPRALRMSPLLPVLEVSMTGHRGFGLSETEILAADALNALAAENADLLE